jgi:hypothetical protein
MYQVGGLDQIDILSSLDIGLCQFTPVVIQTSSMQSPISHSEILYGFKLCRSPYETIIGGSGETHKRMNGERLDTDGGIRET